MLYNKNWDKPEIKADPFSLESLIAWLETRVPATQYNYVACGRCLLAQYFADRGFAGAKITPSHLLYRGDYIELPHRFNDIAMSDRNLNSDELVKDWTFGAALDRARKALAER